MDSCRKLSVCAVVEAWRALLDVLADGISEERGWEVVMAIIIWFGKCFGEVREISRKYGIG